MHMSERKQTIFDAGYIDENGRHVPGSFDAFFDGDYIGSRPTKQQAQLLLDNYVTDGFIRGTIRTDAQLVQELAAWESDQARYDEQAATGIAYLRTVGARMAEYEAAQAATAA